MAFLELLAGFTWSPATSNLATCGFAMFCFFSGYLFILLKGLLGGIALFVQPLESKIQATYRVFCSFRGDPSQTTTKTGDQVSLYVLFF